MGIQKQVHDDLLEFDRVAEDRFHAEVHDPLFLHAAAHQFGAYDGEGVGQGAVRGRPPGAGRGDQSASTTVV